MATREQRFDELIKLPPGVLVIHLINLEDRLSALRDEVAATAAKLKELVGQARK